MIIAGTIAMLGTGILQSNAPVQDAFVEMIGPAGKWIISIGALISIAGLNMGDSLMIPRYGASIADEGLLPKVIAKKIIKCTYRCYYFFWFTNHSFSTKRII